MTNETGAAGDCGHYTDIECHEAGCAHDCTPQRCSRASAVESDALAFFRENAGYSYDPATETAEDGIARCAREMVAAEAWAAATGIMFDWSVDDVQSSDWDDSGAAPHDLWVCVAYAAGGEVVASLSGIDFGPEGKPWGHSYARVVQAELAAQVSA